MNFAEYNNLLYSPPAPAGGYPFIVFNPNGKAPTYRHASLASAEQEATRLSQNNPGEVFYAMQATTVVTTPKPMANIRRLYS